jgi:hypothetical protein
MDSGVTTPWSSWGEAALALPGEVERLATERDAVLVLATPVPAHYVQLHAMPNGDVYGEAGSGQFDGVGLAPELEAALATLGWTAPESRTSKRWLRTRVVPANWSTWWPAPVDIAAAVELIVSTLRDVYRSEPYDVHLSRGEPA